MSTALWLSADVVQAWWVLPSDLASFCVTSWQLQSVKAEVKSSTFSSLLTFSWLKHVETGPKSGSGQNPEPSDRAWQRERSRSHMCRPLIRPALAYLHRVNLGGPDTWPAGRIPMRSQEIRGVLTGFVLNCWHLITCVWSVDGISEITSSEVINAFQVSHSEGLPFRWERWSML